jgi:hypothetical protein
MTEAKPFDPEALIDAAAPLLGLNVIDAYRAGVAANLRLTAALAEFVMSFPLDDHDEPAEVFRA